MANWECPQEWSEWMKWLAVGLHGRCRWRLPILLLGVLFARGPRTVASWLRAAGIGRGFSGYYYFISAVGRKSKSVGTQLFSLLLQKLAQDGRLLLALDDTPTKRYGPKVQGAGIHHNPTPGPADAKYVYGHIWTTLSLVVRHPLWGTIGLPLLAALYVRRKNISALPTQLGWEFQTKLQQGADLVAWAAKIAWAAGKRLWVVADGAYAKRAFLKPLLKLGVVVVSRLRKDAHLNTLPAKPKKGQRRKRGRQRKYGTKRISLAKRAAARRGWKTIECVQYGKQVVKRYKSFLATYRPAYGTIRVVIVQEATGPQVLLLHRSQRQRHRDSGSLRRSGGDRTRLSRPQGDLGCRPAATPQSVGKHRRVSSVPLDALAGGALGVGQVESRNLRPLRFAVGRSQPTPFARRSSQSIAAQRPPTSISVAYPLPRCGWKNRRLRPAVGQAGRVTQSFFRKCRSRNR